MPQFRQIHTKIIDSFDFNEMPDDFHRVTWMLLPLIADGEGRGIDNPAWVRSKLYPLRDDVTIEQVAAALAWFAGRGMIVRYSVENKRFYYIVNFKKYQRGTERESKSVLPAPVITDNPQPTQELVASKSGVSQEEVKSKSSPNEYDYDYESVKDSKIDENSPIGELSQLEAAFTNAARLPILAGGEDRSIKAYRRMKDAGVTPDDITRAVAILQDKKYRIVGPSSVANTAVMVAGERLRAGEQQVSTAPQGESWFYG